MTSPLDWISLSLVPGLGLASFWRLIDHFKSPTRVLHASQAELLRVRGVREQFVAGLKSAQEAIARGQKELDRLKKIGASAIPFDDEAYPLLLRQLPDPPPVLYTLGRINLLHQSAIAIVGSRAATSYGRKVAYNLAAKLADRSVTIVSGLAMGIDAESHAGALTGTGSTVAVLGCGLDIIYPRQNTALFKKIIECGTLVSEYPLGTHPEGFRFPARNRIIAGLSKGVVVVEAAKRSGSLITAQIALDCGREVFAVPGQIDSAKSEGTHWLLKQGAKLVHSAADILEELEVFSPQESSGKSTGGQETVTSLDPDAVALLSHLDSYGLAREQLLNQTGMTAARLSELLLILELDGLIEIIAGDKVRKV